MDLSAMQKEVQERLNKYRRLNSLVNGDSFKAIFESSTDKDSAITLASDGDYNGLLRWVERQKLQILEFMPVSQLRVEARLYGVPNYHLLMREELIERIKACRT